MRHFRVRALASRLLILAALLVSGLLRAAPVSVTMAINEDGAPPYILQQADAKQLGAGIAVELAQKAADQCQIALKIEWLPSARLLYSLKNNTAQAGLMLSYNAERAEFLVFPWLDHAPNRAARIAVLRYLFYVKNDSTLTWDGTRLSQPNAIIGTNFKWSSNAELENRGIQVETANSILSNFRKLEANRIAAYVTHEQVAAVYFQKNPALKNIRALPIPLVEKDYFLPFTKTFAESHPKDVRCMWRKIAEQREGLFKARLAFYLKQ